MSHPIEPRPIGHWFLHVDLDQFVPAVEVLHVSSELVIGALPAGSSGAP